MHAFRAQIQSDDRFEIRGQLGSGSFGTVYEAFDRYRERPVALKVLDRVAPDTVARFKREFRSLAEIRRLLRRTTNTPKRAHERSSHHLAVESRAKNVPDKIAAVAAAKALLEVRRDRARRAMANRVPFNDEGASTRHLPD